MVCAMRILNHVNLFLFLLKISCWKCIWLFLWDCTNTGPKGCFRRDSTNTGLEWSRWDSTNTGPTGDRTRSSCPAWSSIAFTIDPGGKGRCTSASRWRGVGVGCFFINWVLFASGFQWVHGCWLSTCPLQVDEKQAARLALAEKVKSGIAVKIAMDMSPETQAAIKAARVDRKRANSRAWHSSFESKGAPLPECLYYFVVSRHLLQTPDVGLRCFPQGLFCRLLVAMVKSQGCPQSCQERWWEGDRSGWKQWAAAAAEWGKLFFIFQCFAQRSLEFCHLVFHGICIFWFVVLAIEFLLVVWLAVFQCIWFFGYIYFCCDCCSKFSSCPGSQVHGWWEWWYEGSPPSVDEFPGTCSDHGWPWRGPGVVFLVLMIWAPVVSTLGLCQMSWRIWWKLQMISGVVRKNMRWVHLQCDCFEPGVVSCSLFFCQWLHLIKIWIFCSILVFNF